MSVRGGGMRERTRREDKDRPPPPSRHLWVGNIPQGISERELTDRFLRFGELESIAFQHGRSYAFINYKHEEDAFAAIDSLQGFQIVAGNPLRIEFAKADKSSIVSRADDQFHWDEQRSTIRSSPFPQKDFRTRHSSPDSSNRSKLIDKDGEPSEVLWIGFPALLKVDEAILRKAFSPFGEIEKITVFPGRTYAFVQFRSLMAACRAKETLQGKLFGNPRVHICFAKSEPLSSNSGRGPPTGSLSPRSRFSDRLDSDDDYLRDRNYRPMSRDSSVRISHFMADTDTDDLGDYNSRRSNAYEKVRFGEKRYEHELLQEMYEPRGSSRETVSAYHDSSCKFPQKSSLYEESWDLPEDAYSNQEAKRLKTDSFFPDKELPEYQLIGSEGEHRFSRASADLPPHDAFEAGPLRFKQIPDHLANSALYHGERGNLRAYTPDRPSLKDWKWEGTIAKGGNPICRARCFPVGKVMDMMLPELLDCTARTGLDMLAKHYYQASNAWVVFFVPGSDGDIGFYNEFMHYLEEKQRAAVTKLDDRTTLFLVPPSEFSEKVLKVPGKLSISGVILRLEYPSSGFGPIQQPDERRDSNLLTYHGETSYPKPTGTFPDIGKPGMTNMSFVGSTAVSVPSTLFSGSAHSTREVPNSYVEQPPSQRLGPNWPSHDRQYSVPTGRSAQPQTSYNNIDHTVHGHNSVAPGYAPGTSSSHFPETKPSSPLAALPPEQLVQLASTLLGQQKQVGNLPNQSERYASESNHMTPGFPASQFSQGQQMQQQQLSHMPTTVQREVQLVAPASQNLQSSSSSQEETEADPQKRLQATLQLAAALLQQIQQGKGT